MERDLKNLEDHDISFLVHFDGTWQMYLDLWFLLLSSAVCDHRLITPSQFRQ